MARTPQLVTNAEAALLTDIMVSEEGGLTVRNLVEKHYPTGTPSDLATVQKLLKRLEDKGFINRDRGVSPQRVTADKTQGQCVREELHAVLSKYLLPGQDFSELCDIAEGQIAGLRAAN